MITIALLELTPALFEYSTHLIIWLLENEENRIIVLDHCKRYLGSRKKTYWIHIETGALLRVGAHLWSDGKQGWVDGWVVEMTPEALIGQTRLNSQ